jgi:methionyl-tRNA synthetase
MGDHTRVLLEHSSRAVEELKGHMEDLAFDRALKSIWGYIGAANKYIDSAAPWTLAKEGKDTKLDSVLYSLFEAIRQVAVMITPFMPETGQKMFRQLGLANKKDLTLITSLGKWGKLPGGTRTFKGPALFPRIEKTSASPEIPDVKKEETDMDDNLIGIDEFAKVELVAGRVLEAESVPKSKKLIRLIVDTGEKRQLVAGIAEYYSPEDLVDKRIAVVVNLKPATLMGVESRGMLLAAEDGNGIHIVTFDEDVKPGTRIK